MDASCKSNRKNNKIQALFGVKEQFILECQFIWGSIFAAWNQCLDENGKIESVIQSFSHIIICIAYIVYCIFGSLWMNILVFTKMVNAIKGW